MDIPNLLYFSVERLRCLFKCAENKSSLWQFYGVWGAACGMVVWYWQQVWWVPWNETFRYSYAEIYRWQMDDKWMIMDEWKDENGWVEGYGRQMTRKLVILIKNAGIGYVLGKPHGLNAWYLPGGVWPLISPCSALSWKHRSRSRRRKQQQQQAKKKIQTVVKNSMNNNEVVCSSCMQHHLTSHSLCIFLVCKSIHHSPIIKRLRNETAGIWPLRVF